MLQCIALRELYNRVEPQPTSYELETEIVYDTANAAAYTAASTTQQQSTESKKRTATVRKRKVSVRAKEKSASAY